MVYKSGISQVASIAIVVMIIIAGFIGFAVGHFNQPTVASTQSGSSVTLTEFVVVKEIATVSLTISGTCTLGGGTIQDRPTGTTTFVQPTNIQVTGYLNVTITTITSFNNPPLQTLLTTLSTTSNNDTTSACPTFA